MGRVRALAEWFESVEFVWDSGLPAYDRFPCRRCGAEHFGKELHSWHHEWAIIRDICWDCGEAIGVVQIPELEQAIEALADFCYGAGWPEPRGADRG